MRRHITKTNVDQRGRYLNLPQSRPEHFAALAQSRFSAAIRGLYMVIIDG